jgi:hypothetical protein
MRALVRETTVRYKPMKRVMDVCSLLLICYCKVLRYSLLFAK